MRLHRLAPALLGVVLPLAVAPGFSQAAVADPTAPPDSASAALEALTQAQEVLQGLAGGAGEHAGHAGDEGAEHVEATLALLELRRALPHLDPADRRTARRLMARPDVDTDDPTTWESEDADKANGAAWGTREADAAQVDCSGVRFCVHWVPAGTQVTIKGKLVESPHSATQAEVDGTIAALKRVWDRETAGAAAGGLGYREPLGDGTTGGKGLVGNTGQLDVYLANTGSKRIFGYVVPEGSVDEQTSTGYMVIENDFREFTSSTAVANGLRQVTAAHEFFHLVQLAYDADESWWLMESTATWMEEQVYDAVNDNRYYLPVSSLQKPWQPLDTFDDTGAQYGNWVFHELMTQRHGVSTMRTVWIAAAKRRYDNARSALHAAASAEGSSLATEFHQFTGAALAPRHSWSEGGAYPSATVSRTWLLGRRATTDWVSARVNHMASRVYAFKPRSGLTARDWKLRLRVDAPQQGGTAYVVVVRTDGSITRHPVRLDGDGNATRSFPFAAGLVRQVKVALGNTTTRDGRTTQFKATTWR